MKSFAAVIVLILAQANPGSSGAAPYADLVRGSDVVVTAWMDHAELEATEKQTNWTVLYRVKDVLKGEHSGSELTLKFDSDSLKRVDLSGRGTKEQHKLLILFLRSKTGGGFMYIGPPLNSPTIMATSANLSALKRTLAEEQEIKTSWLDTILPGGIAGYVLVGAIILILIALIVVIRRRPKQSADYDSEP